MCGSFSQTFWKMHELKQKKIVLFVDDDGFESDSTISRWFVLAIMKRYKL